MKYTFLFFFVLLTGCNTDDTVIDDSDNIAEDIETPTDETEVSDSSDASNSLYFPPIGSDTWETTTIEELGWNTNAIDELNAFLEDNNTKAFIILKDGKIVLENYYQETDVSTAHRWNSAAKTLTATTIGIAEQEGFLCITDTTTDYLGSNWTSMTTSQESEITIRNQLTMTTGGDYNIPNSNCTDPECLLFLNEPGTEWYYHNAYYTLLQDVVAAAVPNDFNTYFDTKIKSPTGITGIWVPVGYFRLYYSNARSMARFGLLSLNNGNWDNTEVINPDYFSEMTNPSQDINEAYGYLWWLNGQNSYRLPGTTTTFTGNLIPTAPDDLIAGLGKDDQKLYVVPSEGLVIVRLGDASDASLPGPSGFDTDLWEKLNAVFD